MTATLDESGIFQDFRFRLDQQYYRIVALQIDLFVAADKDWKTVAQVRAGEGLADLLTRASDTIFRRSEATYVGITFSAMCLEAFFYDYSAIHLGDSFTSDHLDRLDLPSKLLIIPKLVLGKGIVKSSNTYRLVSQLTKRRNRLVHYKSANFTGVPFKKALERLNTFDDDLDVGLRDGVRAVEETLKELDLLHGTPGQYFNRVCNADIV